MKYVVGFFVLLFLLFFWLFFVLFLTIRFQRRGVGGTFFWFSSLKLILRWVVQTRTLSYHGVNICNIFNAGVGTTLRTEYRRYCASWDIVLPKPGGSLSCVVLQTRRGKTDTVTYCKNNFFLLLLLFCSDFPKT